jgi:4'-phosphopantetheinyl transferase
MKVNCELKMEKESELAVDQVQLWWLDLEVSKAELKRLVTFLDPQEKARANRFVDQDLYRNFVVRRARLRQILAKYLGLDPKELKWEYSDKGKPGLGPAWPDICFNASASGIRGLVAVAQGSAIGCDLEEIKPGFLFETVAERFFSSNELDQLMRQPAPKRAEMFYQIWTSKEAQLKYSGVGLAGLESLAFGPSKRSQIFGHIIIEENYVGALCCEAKITRYLFKNLQYCS